MTYHEAITIRPFVERAWNIGLFKEKTMSPSDAAFVKKRLSAQSSIERKADLQKRDPEAWAKRLEKARRYNRAYRERMKANAARV